MEEYKSERKVDVHPDDVIVEVKDGSFCWGFRVKEDQKGNEKGRRGKVEIEKDDKPIIENISLNLKKGDHMIIVGQVGCGKTTLLHSLMEEAKKISGHMNIQGNIAYVE